MPATFPFRTYSPVYVTSTNRNRYAHVVDLFPCLCNSLKQEQENTAQEDTGAIKGFLQTESIPTTWA